MCVRSVNNPPKMLMGRCCNISQVAPSISSARLIHNIWLNIRTSKHIRSHQWHDIFSWIMVFWSSGETIYLVNQKSRTSCLRGAESLQSFRLHWSISIKTSWVNGLAVRANRTGISANNMSATVHQTCDCCWCFYFTIFIFVNGLQSNEQWVNLPCPIPVLM